MQALRHVSSAIEHAERLADEAEELQLTEVSAILRGASCQLAEILDAAFRAFEALPHAKEAQRRGQAALATTYAAVTHDLYATLPPTQAAVLTPGGKLDVADRARYRLRRAPRPVAPRVETAAPPWRERLAAALVNYEDAVDAYLHLCAVAHAKRDTAVAESQRLRLQLERHKLTLLAVAEVGSPQWQRIKRRTVRTKPAAWLAYEGFGAQAHDAMEV